MIGEKATNLKQEKQQSFNKSKGNIQHFDLLMPNLLLHTPRYIFWSCDQKYVIFFLYISAALIYLKLVRVASKLFNCKCILNENLHHVMA